MKLLRRLNKACLCFCFISVFLFLFFQSNEIVLDIYRSLFLYAAFNNMAEMAVLFWQYGLNSLMKALVGQLIFQKMHLRALKNPVVSIDIKRELINNER